ncbi:MAG: hypothetical protein IPG80_21960 [Anaerolineales bacterium]|jgi:hypothetical protein|uniref:DUF6056 family protein n=1 Tax=Candidatus Villigracilis vicinus TaxID=3140679 RepID=UPI003135ECE0|nr:hypothetical protein [Anaerolineales bacterium]
MLLRNEKYEPVVRTIVLISTLTMLAAVSMYAYLGSFSRYIADDYCEAVRVTTVSPFQAVLDRYSDGAFRSANRYSNILFVGFSEYLGTNSIPLTIVLMTVLWLFGLSWLVHEIRKFAKVEWSSLVDIFLGSTITFMSFLQAPNLFQTVYWRSSMMTHFAPLVFGALFFAFLVRQARRPVDESIPLVVYGSIFVTAFVLAGFSEPPAATLVTVFALLPFSVWKWNRSPVRARLLALTGCTFAGVFTGFLTLLFSPAVTDVAREKTPDVALILINSFKYAFLFMRDSFFSLPLPLLISFLVPLSLVWVMKQSGGVMFFPEERRRPLWMFLLPLLIWLLIAAGFSPSVFGQGFPVERMRFLARTLMIVMLVLEGIWLGLCLPEFKFNRTIGVWAALLLFVVVSVAYPLRTAGSLIQKSLPEYRERAELWDIRNAFIHRHIEQGEMELFIPGFGGVYGVKELDANPAHWINACAANFYHVTSIQSFSTKNLMEALSE